MADAKRGEIFKWRLRENYATFCHDVSEWRVSRPPPARWVDGSILVWSCLRMSVSFPRSSLTAHGIYGGVMLWSLSLHAVAPAGQVWQPLPHALSCTWGQGAGISDAALTSATWGHWLVERRWPAPGVSSHTPSVLLCFVFSVTHPDPSPSVGPI